MAITAIGIILFYGAHLYVKAKKKTVKVRSSAPERTRSPALEKEQEFIELLRRNEENY
jgi:hypothetical protein